MIEEIEQSPLDENETQGDGLEPGANAGSQAEAPQAEEALDELQARVRGYSKKKWTAIQCVIGVAVGFLCGALVTYFSTLESIGMYGTIAALLIAIFVPRLSEKRVKRSVQKGRVAMMIALAVWIAASALMMALQGVPFFT